MTSIKPAGQPVNTPPQDNVSAARWLPWLLWGLLLLVAAAGHAQDEDIKTMTDAYSLFPLIIKTIFMSALYLVFYAAALTVTLATLKRFFGFDSQMLLWIGVLWLGGMAINWLAYLLVGDKYTFVAGLVAVPLIFGWSLFLGTRAWTDLLFMHAVRVSLVVALVCAPYFSPTWFVKAPPKPPAQQSAAPQALCRWADARLAPPTDTGAVAWRLRSE